MLDWLKMNKLFLVLVVMALTACSKTTEPSDSTTSSEILHIVAGAGGPGHEFNACECSLTFDDNAVVSFTDNDTDKHVYVSPPYVISDK